MPSSPRWMLIRVLFSISRPWPARAPKPIPIHAHDLPSSGWGANRALNLPGITISMKEGIQALRRIGGDDVAARVVFKPVDRIQAMIRTFPARFSTARAVAMGFTADTGIDAIVKDYVASEGIKL